MKNTIFKKTFVLFLQTFFLFITSESLKAEINDVFLIPLFSHIEQERLYNKKAWIKLLHYNKNWLGYKSQVESSIFFNSNEGKINPKSELKSTLRAFFLNPPEDENEHARCRFPARFKWLDQKLNLTKYYKDRLPKISCEALENFKKRAQAKSVSLVFSSYYLNNPASAFGHSFLRLNKKDPTKNKSNEVFELLDQGVNFAANPNTKIPFWYSIGGLMGAFDGSFTMMPYYMKVREYNDFESRDLWSYELNMSEDEVETLILHLWELGPVKFDYYFLSSNCSYQMLTVLEASMPQKDLTSNLPKFWKIPSDTLKSLTSQKALVKQVRFRPSVATKFRYQLEGLDFIQKKILTKSISDKNLNQIKSINDDKKKVEVLDALIGYLEYKYPYDLVLKKSESKNWKHKILLKRSTFPIKTKERKIVIDEKERPDKGHRSQRMGVHYGYHKTQKSYFEFSPRFAFHDLLDKAEGYPKHSHLEVMSWRFRYGFEKKRI